MYKLIRDRIPELAAKDGKELMYAAANSSALYRDVLNKKVLEEATELAKALADYEACRGKSCAGLRMSDAIEEVVDLMEVLDAILAEYNFSLDEIKTKKFKKAKERGAFSKKLIGFFNEDR